MKSDVVWKTQEGKNEIEHSGVIRKGRDSDFSLESLNSRSREKRERESTGENEKRKVRNLNSGKTEGKKTKRTKKKN